MIKTIESHLHSLIKAVSWRILSTLITIAISYVVTHNVSFALAIGSAEVMAKIALYYFHERAWLAYKPSIVAAKETSRR